MHVHQSLWKGDTNKFFDAKGYGMISQLVSITSAVCFIIPVVTGPLRPDDQLLPPLVPGYEAPINLVYSQRNRSASVRIPLYSKSAKSKRIEYRCPDSSCNPYLAFPAMMLAGLDGIKNKIDPAPRSTKIFMNLNRKRKLRLNPLRLPGRGISGSEERP